MASRPKRHQQIETDDVVLTRVLEFTEWAKRNLVLVGVVVGALVLLVAGFFWYRADQTRREDNAAIAFLQVEQAVLSGDDAIATRELQAFIEQHNGTLYANEARLLLAQIHLRGGRAAEAVELLRPLAEDIRSTLGPQAALLLASAQEAAGQTDQAIQTYLRVADEAEAEFRRRQGLEGAAMLRSQQGDYAGAAELYARLVQMTEPGSAERSMYEMRLAEAKALAGAQ